MSDSRTETQKGRAAGEAASRRTFFKIAVGVIATVETALLGGPFVKALLGAGRKKKAPRWLKAAQVSALSQGGPIEVKFLAPGEDAYHHTEALHSIWAVKHSDTEVTVFSPVCTHLGCHFVWNDTTSSFECPCHASVFNIEGKVLSGPAPRPLDRLDAKIEEGTLYIKWERFRTGSPAKAPV